VARHRRLKRTKVQRPWARSPKPTKEPRVPDPFPSNNAENAGGADKRRELIQRAISFGSVLLSQPTGARYLFY
jgi:hypothetical protein